MSAVIRSYIARGATRMLQQQRCEDAAEQCGQPLREIESRTKYYFDSPTGDVACGRGPSADTCRCQLSGPDRKRFG